MSNIDPFLKKSRKLLRKVRDLEFGNKVSKIYSRKIDGKLTIILYLSSFVAYAECVFDQVNEPRVAALKTAFVNHMASLISEVEKRGQGHFQKLTIDSTLVTEAIKAYSVLIAEVKGSKVVLNNCNDSWLPMTSAASHIWGNDV